MITKKHTCIFFLHLFLWGFCCGQEIELIPLDFSSPVSLQKQLEDKPETLIFGKLYQVRVSNVNRRLFTVETTVTKSDNNATIPSAFGSIVLPSYLNFGKLIKEPNSSGAMIVADMAKDEPSLEARMKRLDEILSGFQKLSEYQNNLKRLHFSCGEAWSSIEDKLLQDTRGFLSLPSGERMELRTHLHDALANLLQATGADLKIVKGAVKTNIDSLDKKLAEDKLSLKGINLVSANDLVFRNARELTNNISINETNVAFLKDVNSQLDKALVTYEENKKTDLVSTVLNNFDLINESNYSYSSPPFKVDADEVEFSITITAKAPIACGVGFEQAVLLKRKAVGKLKVDFSTGFMASFGNERFFDQQATFRKMSDSTSVVDIGPKPSVLLSIGAFAHIYKRTGNKVNFALSPGISTTTSLETVNLHLGGSLLYGFRDRLIITTGLTFRQATLFDDTNLSLDEEHSTGLLPDAPPTKKLFPQTGVFFGLSYNLSRPKTE